MTIDELHTLWDSKSEHHRKHADHAEKIYITVV